MSTLHIYNDEDTVADRCALDRAPGRMSMPVSRWGCHRAASLTSILNHHLAAGHTFDRVVIDTHGAPGVIGFGDDDVTVEYWLRGAANIRTGLCTPGAHVYFSGCNVAEGADGWAFLEGAAAFWLKGAGGRTSGWTSVGFADAVFSTGRVWHPWGTHRIVHADSSGRLVSRTGA